MKFQAKRILFILALYIHSAQAQEVADSTSIRLKDVQVSAYFQKQPLIQLTSAVQQIQKSQLQDAHAYNLVSALNSIPGVRMEERSPGSYRLALRGNMLRSPFGVRNIKIYMDEFPLTDAGGNTYFNLLDPASIAEILVLKGPDGSLFGANTGGVLKITPMGFQSQAEKSQVEVNYGSFKQFQQRILWNRKKNDRYQYSISQNYQKSDGYRDQSALEKFNIQTAHEWQYAEKSKLKAYGYYTKLDYETPGGLTLAQYEENPRMSRPAAGNNPSAAEQQAGIRMNSFYFGLHNQQQIAKNLSHELVLFSAFNEVQNPFITNFEKRQENNVGFRTFLNYQKPVGEQSQWQTQIGVEYQKGWFHIRNYDNFRGTAMDMQAEDKMENEQYFIFLRNALTIGKKLNLEASLSLNDNHIRYQQFFPTASPQKDKLNFDASWMPRFAASYLLFDQWSVRAVIAKGFSAPTIAEVRSSNNIINLDLQAERGTNYELGTRLNLLNDRLNIDLAAYSYAMKNGIVRQLDENAAEYFQNAGRMSQKGFEAQVNLFLIPPNTLSWIRGWQISSSLNLQRYKFLSYEIGNTNYSGNDITAVPKKTLVTQTQLDFPFSLRLNLHHTYTSKLPLNDANSVYADGFHVFNLRAHWILPTSGKTELSLFGSINNLTNEKYSLGNDINAFGGRYYNPAASRNVNIGLRASL